MINLYNSIQNNVPKSKFGTIKKAFNSHSSRKKIVILQILLLNTIYTKIILLLGIIGKCK